MYSLLTQSLWLSSRSIKNPDDEKYNERCYDRMDSKRVREASTGLRPWYPSFLRRNPPKHPPSLSELRRVPLAHSSMGLRPWSSAKADKNVSSFNSPMAKPDLPLRRIRPFPLISLRSLASMAFALLNKKCPG